MTPWSYEYLTFISRTAVTWQSAFETHAYTHLRTIWVFCKIQTCIFYIPKCCPNSFIRNLLILWSRFVFYIYFRSTTKYKFIGIRKKKGKHTNSIKKGPGNKEKNNQKSVSFENRSQEISRKSHWAPKK